MSAAGPSIVAQFNTTSADHRGTVEGRTSEESES